MYTQFVDAIKEGKRIAQWTDNSKQSLEDWKTKAVARFGDSVTFSELQDNPEIDEREQMRAAIQALKDPAAKKLWRYLLKSLMDEE